MTQILSAVLLAASLASARAATTVQAPLPDDPLQVSIHRLPNGLTVYLSPNRQEPRVFSAIAVRAGAKDDPDDSTGMAHYLEHMLFKGSERLGTLSFEKEKPHLDRISALYDRLFVTTAPAARADVYRQIDAQNVKASAFAVPNELDKLYNRLGFTGVNAYTTDERTVYTSNFPANRAEAWAAVESERFAHPVFRLFQTEIEAVYEEKNRSLDNPDRILHEALEARLYKFHPYGQRTVLGSIEHLKNPSLAKMYAYFHERYRPSNMAIVLAGDFDRDAMLALIEKRFGAWRPEPAAPHKTWPLPPPKGEETVEVRYEAEERVFIAWPTVPENHPDQDALDVMDMLMDNSQAGLINLRLNQAQKVKAAGSYPATYNDAGSWQIWAAAKKGQTLEQARALLLETVEALKRGEFTDDDLKAVITDVEVSEKRKFESNDARGAMMVEAYATLEDWPHAAGRLARLRKISKADVLRVARKYLGPDRVVAYRREGKPELPSIQKPRFTKVDIDPNRQSAFFREVRDLPAKPLEPKFLVEGRDFRVRDASWGRLYFSSNPINDLFALTFAFDRGRRHERTLCEAMRLLELSGGGALSAEDFKRKLYSLGSTMAVGCGEQLVSVTVTGLEPKLEATLDLIRSRFETPNVATDTLRDMIDVELGARRDNKKNPAYLAFALGEFAQRGRESSVLTDLSNPELQALDLEALRGLIRGLFAYRRSALYVGLRPPESIEPLLRWGKEPYAAAPAYAPRRYEHPASPRALFVHRDMVQSRLGVFAADGAYDPERAVDYLYYASYMGGSMSGVYFQEVRESRALAYSAGGGYRAGERTGDENIVWASAGTQGDKTVEAGELVRELLRKMPLSDARFDETRKAVEEDFRGDVVTFREIPGEVFGWERKGLRSDPRPEWFRKALAYRAEDLVAFAKRFETKTLTTYVLGNRSRVDPKELARFGAVTELKIDDLFPY